jgi:pimeloyl-ACP methyl ester carboxylesterase
MFLEIDGNKVFTLSFGKGPRTFLAHSGWIGSFEDWIATLAPLSETWRTVVYDHRGAGETVVPVDRNTPEALIDDVFRVMDALKIERCVLAGFSRGTVTVMRAVLKRPERFVGLVLMNGYGEVRMPDAPASPRVAPSKWPGADFKARLRWFAERCTPEPNSKHIRRWAQNILSRSTEEVADKIMMMEAEERIDWVKRLPELRIPTLLIHGDQDPFYQTETMRYVHSLIPNSKLVEFEGSGHLPAMARPMDVATVIDEFFAERL